MTANPDIKQWREARALSQSRLAELLPVNLRTLQNWEAVPQKGKPPEYLWRALEHLNSQLSISTNPSEGRKDAQEKRNRRNERNPGRGGASHAGGRDSIAGSLDADNGPARRA